MSELVQKTDYAEDITILLETFRNKPNFLKLLESLQLTANDIEAAIFELRDGFFLSSAIGVQLDVIGTIVGLDRQGLSDEDYRLELIAYAGTAKAGTPEEILTLGRNLVPTSTKVYYLPAYPGGYRVVFVGIVLTQVELDTLVAKLEKASPSGVAVATQSDQYYNAATSADNLSFSDGSNMIFDEVVYSS